MDEDSTFTGSNVGMLLALENECVQTYFYLKEIFGSIAWGFYRKQKTFYDKEQDSNQFRVI